MKPKTSVNSLLNEAKISDTYLKVCAPMVRYSKVQFRTLVRRYGVDLCFTPMIMANSFCQSAKARSNEFTTTSEDTPLIVQFAANSATEFIDASKLVFPFADGVDLNCGCPQRWAIKDGYGCALLQKPEFIHSVVREFRNSLPDSFSMSVKIRLMKDLKETVELCQQLQRCGVSFITVHGRTAAQKTSEDVNVDELRNVCSSIDIPVIANGGVKTLEDANTLQKKTLCAGVMAASGLLTNPALFSGYNLTPLSAIQDWLSLCETNKITFQCYHHHLVFMLEKILTKKEKQVFNYLKTFDEVNRFIFNKFGIEPYYCYDDELECEYDNRIVSVYSKCSICCSVKCECVQNYNSCDSDGKYFSSVVECDSDLDLIDGSLFDENI